MSAFWQLARRDVVIAWKEGGTIGVALGFYLVVVVLLPLGLGPDLNLLSRIAPGVLWIALMLAALLSLGRLFEADFEDGSLDILATGTLPLEAVVAAKALAHWLTTALPLMALTPVLGLLLNLAPEAYGVLLATMLVGTPAVSFLGAIGAAMTVRTRRGGLLLGLLLTAAVRANADFRDRGRRRGIDGGRQFPSLLSHSDRHFARRRSAGAAGSGRRAQVSVAMSVCNELHSRPQKA